MNKPIYLTALLWLCLFATSLANDGYKLWLDYQPIGNSQLKSQVDQLLSGVYFYGENPTYEAIRNELNLASKSMLGKVPVYSKDRLQNLDWYKRATFAGTFTNATSRYQSSGCRWILERRSGIRGKIILCNCRERTRRGSLRSL